MLLRFARFALLLLIALEVCGAAESAGSPPLTLTPLRKTGIYGLNERAGWTVTLPPGASAPAEGYTYALKKNNFEIIASGKLDLESGSATIAARVEEPAFLYLEITPGAAGGRPARAGAAIAPEKLQPVAARPDDFDTFWAEKIKLLQSIPANPVVTPGDSGKPGVEYATVKLTNVGGAHVYGQLAKPARAGKFPAMLILQWASPPYPLEKAWVTDRAAEGWLALDVQPHDVPIDLPKEFYAALPEMIKRYETIYHDDRERNYFLQMYLGDYRAADYLASRPDWDGRTFLVTGTSMGGQQSLVIAGLHPRVTHLIVHVPAGADANGALHGRASGYPFWDSANSKVMQTALYFDTVNFASRIKVPSLVSLGFIDYVCPPAGVWTAFNQINGPKEIVPLVEAAHNHESSEEQQRAYYERSAAWLNALVRGEAPEVRGFVR